MLQVFYLGVAKVDLMLHPCCNRTHLHNHLLQLLGDVQAALACCWDAAEWAQMGA
jgi:hypothetical protein